MKEEVRSGGVRDKQTPCHTYQPQPQLTLTNHHCISLSNLHLSLIPNLTSLSPTTQFLTYVSHTQPPSRFPPNLLPTFPTLNLPLSSLLISYLLFPHSTSLSLPTLSLTYLSHTQPLSLFTAPLQNAPLTMATCCDSIPFPTTLN